jgi:phage terminase large subunit-like protein
MQLWILHGWRDQVTVPAVARKLLELSQRFWHAPVVVEAVQGFKSVPQILREIEPRLKIREAKMGGDKFVRAQGVAAAWNAGRVYVPLDAEFTEWIATKGAFALPVDPNTNQPYVPKLRAGVARGVTWADELIAEALRFTGVGDVEDDQVDALAHGFNELWGYKQPQRGSRKNQNPFG